jgi:AcrR family transcriptional regulator
MSIKYSNKAELFRNREGQMASNKDRRVQRTHKLLRESLFSLIQEKGFEKLSVQDIIDHANVGRATFYAHFDNKEDLLLSGFDALRVFLKKRQSEALSSERSVDERIFAYSHDLLSHIDEHRHLFRAMSGERSHAVVQNALHRLTIDLVRGDLKAMADQRDSPGAIAEALVEFIAGGLFGLLMWWLGDTSGLSVEDLNAQFRRFAIPAARAAV